jgi:hypothetical protein
VVALEEVSIRIGPPLGSEVDANRDALHHRRSLTGNGGGSRCGSWGR